MRTVKPLFLLIERRIIEFIENVIEALLAIAGKRALHNPLERHFPNREARLAICKRNRRNPLEYTIILYKIRIAREIKATDENENENQRGGGEPPRLLTRGECGQERRERESDNEPYDCPARLGEENEYRLNHRERDERPFEPWATLREREPERNEGAEKKVDREIRRVAKRCVYARRAL